MYKIAFVDDHSLFSSVLSTFLKEQNPNYDVDHFDDPDEFLKNYAEQEYQLLILDLEMPGKSGIEVIHLVREKVPTQPIIVLSMFYNEQLAYELQKLNVQSFLPKNVDAGELQKAIQLALERKSYFRSDVTPERIDSIKQSGFLLTRRELEIIKCSAAGLTSREMGEKLFISEGTVKTHVKNIINKTNSSNIKEVISNFQKEGWEVLT
ncbi:MAG: response regulator transcription factor [Cyclobacteriaceae bacterium]